MVMMCALCVLHGVLKKKKTPNNKGRPAPILGVTMANGVDVTMEETPSISIGGSAVAARELGCVFWRSGTC